MKYLFVSITLFIGFNSISQSKKEQIAILIHRLDSLEKEYIKDTTFLSNTIETIDREYTMITMQYSDAQEKLQKKSATITDKSNTIKSLNKKNMDLMTELKGMRKTLNSMELDNKRFKKSLDSLNMVETKNIERDSKWIRIPQINSLIGVWMDDCEQFGPEGYMIRIDGNNFFMGIEYEFGGGIKQMDYDINNGQYRIKFMNNNDVAGDGSMSEFKFYHINNILSFVDMDNELRTFNKCD